MIKSEYQEWNDGQLIHGYIEFDRTKAIVNGNEKAVSRYDYCLHQSHDHHFKWWFDIGPIRAIILAHLKGGHRKHITGNL